MDVNLTRHIAVRFGVGALLLLPAACRTSPEVTFGDRPSLQHQPDVLRLETPDVCPEDEPGSDLLDLAPPVSTRGALLDGEGKRGDYQEPERRPMTLEECVQLALQSPVLRDLGGRVLTAPAGVSTIYDPALQETDLRQGPEAALAAFDAQFGSSLTFTRDEQGTNNAFFTGVPVSPNSTANFQAGITKTAPTGTTFSVRNQTNYNRSNLARVPAVFLFRSTYDTLFTAEFRHPLLQGSGLEFNRIAGPNASPGNYNGVLLGRLNSDIALTDFEASVRDMLRDVERTYWELYFAYRDLDARASNRDAALQFWRLKAVRFQGGDTRKDEEALARQNYYLAQAQVDEALSGRTSGSGGVFAVERQLRRLLGLPTSDGTVIVPITPPTMTDMTFDWSGSIAMSLMRRVELRRQQWNIKRAELQLIASRNYQRARLDLVGQYNWRGFGDNLFNDNTVTVNTSQGPTQIKDSAFGSLFSGQLSGWVMGLELTTPVGNRIGHLAVRNAQLQVQRQRILLEDQQKQVATELHAAFTEIDRAYAIAHANYNRYIAAGEQLQVLQTRLLGGADAPEFVIGALQRRADAESAFHRAVVDYNLALMNLHYVRGTLLDNYHVYLEEGAWSQAAHQQAARIARRFLQRNQNYCLNDYRLSRGSYIQRLATTDGTAAMTPQQVPPAEAVPPVVTPPRLTPPAASPGPAPADAGDASVQGAAGGVTVHEPPQPAASLPPAPIIQAAVTPASRPRLAPVTTRRPATSGNSGQTGNTGLPIPPALQMQGGSSAVR